MERDLDLASKLGGNNPKNYQIWYHRRSLLERLFTTYETSSNADTKIDILKKAKKELTYVSGVLMEDAKNYHVSFPKKSISFIFEFSFFFCKGN